jgi:hypothetical protein
MGSLQKALQRARDNRRKAASIDAATARASAPELLRQGILNFFTPVYAIFDQLYHNNVYLLLGIVPSRITAGTTMKNFLERVGGTPEIVQNLNSDCTLVITLATRGTPRTLADLATAKWRCRIQQQNGPDLANQLIGSLETLVDWISQVIAEYECEAPPQQDVALPAAPPPQEAPAREREQPVIHEDTGPQRRERVILLDDLTEETHASNNSQTSGEDHDHRSA